VTIKKFISNHIDPSYNENDELTFTIKLLDIEKNKILTPLNSIEQRAFLLVSGICKISMFTNGEERILEFFFPGSFFSSYTSFLTQTTSQVEVSTLTDCSVEIIEYTDIQNAYKTSLLANKLGRIVTEKYYIQKTKREKDFLTKTAKERYLELMDLRPELVQQIPVTMIAKYLGIQPESLSRIRKEIS
jgi:CRP/FNR family transcriptional regulator, anaerobic regulatory protein